MNLWDSIKAGAGDLFDNAKSTAGSLAGAVYDRAADLATSAVKSTGGALDQVGDGLAKLTNGELVPWDTHTGPGGTPVEKSPASASVKKPSGALLVGVAVAGLLLFAALTSKKGK